MTDKEIILVADDSKNDVFLLEMACRKAELPNPLRIVRNGEETINYLQGANEYADRSKYPMPSLLLLDLNMPRKNGFDVLAWLRVQPGLRRLPVFIFTASMRAADLERAYELGANSFLVKPTSMPELVEMIRSLRDWLRVNQFPPV